MNQVLTITSEVEELTENYVQSNPFNIISVGLSKCCGIKLS
jgi:hypothetical protein